MEKSKFDSYERHVVWRYLYLKPNLHLLGKKDRQIISKYIDFVDTTKLPKRDSYIEGVYKQPVKNIVDYEKTLSVEEAIARSEQEEIPKEKKKHHFLKKKPMIEDIIEMDEDDEFVNNQILNFKKK